MRFFLKYRDENELVDKKLVEVAGIEPASNKFSDKASTCLAAQNFYHRKVTQPPFRWRVYENKLRLLVYRTE